MTDEVQEAVTSAKDAQKKALVDVNDEVVAALLRIPDQVEALKHYYRHSKQAGQLELNVARLLESTASSIRSRHELSKRAAE